MIEFALRTIVAYLLGSLNGALLLGRLRGVDIRTQGSGNAGGTNALRTQGPLFAIGVIIIDVAKAWIAVKWVPGDVEPGMWLAASCGFAAVLGHVYPIFHGFRGGKGVATVLGTLLALSPLLLAGVLVIWLVMMFVFGFVGLGSMVAAGAMPLLVLWAARAGTIEPGFMGSYGFLPSPGQIDALVGVRPDYLEAAWDEVDQVHGGSVRYFEQAGLDAKVQAALRTILVE